MAAKKQSPTPALNAWQRWLDKQPKAVQIAFTAAVVIVLLICLFCTLSAVFRSI
jgi:hypothetical protein